MEAVTTEVLLDDVRSCRDAAVPGRPNNVVSLSGVRADRCAPMTNNHRLAALGVAATADFGDVGCRQAATVMTHYMNHRMEQLDIPWIPQFLELIADSDAGMYGFKSVRGPVRAGEARLHPAGPGHHHRR